MNINLLEKIAKNKLELWILFSQLNKTCNNHFRANNYKIQLDFEHIISKYPCHNTIIAWYNSAYNTKIPYNNLNDIFYKACCNGDKKLFAFSWRVTCIKNNRFIDIEVNITNFNNDKSAHIVKHYDNNNKKHDSNKLTVKIKNICNNTMFKEYEYSEFQKQNKFLIKSGRYQQYKK